MIYISDYYWLLLTIIDLGTMGIFSKLASCWEIETVGSDDQSASEQSLPKCRRNGKYRYYH